jgi:GNAT superfamily N-acetyltransferase
VPDPAERARVLYAAFRIFVEHALAHGEVWTTLHRDGAAVWFPQTVAPPPEIPDYDTRLALATGPHVDRFRTLDECFERHHPHLPHHYLAFLAVAPHRQNAWRGSSLLTHYHARLDRAGTPAYLEASSKRSRELYRRHGYTDHGPEFRLPDGLPCGPCGGRRTTRPGAGRVTADRPVPRHRLRH